MENKNFEQIQTTNQNAGILDCEYAAEYDLFCSEDQPVWQSIDNCVISGGYDGEPAQTVLGKRDRCPSVTETESEFESNSWKLPHVSLREPSDISSGSALHTPRSDTLEDILAIVRGASYRSYPTQEFYQPLSSDLSYQQGQPEGRFDNSLSFVDEAWPVYQPADEGQELTQYWPWGDEGRNAHTALFQGVQLENGGTVMRSAAAPVLGINGCGGLEFYQAEWQTEYTSPGTQQAILTVPMTGNIHQAVYDADVSEELLLCMADDLEGAPDMALLTLIKYMSGVQKPRFKVANMASSHEIDAVTSLLQRQRKFAGSKAVLRLGNVQTALYKKTPADMIAEISLAIDQSETVFIPCYDFKHWSLLLLFTDKSGKHRVLFIDSMRAPCVSDTAKAAAYIASKAMWQVSVPPEIVRASARQTNGHDCGYFVLENIIRGWIDLDSFVACLGQGKAPFTQADVTVSMAAIRRVFDTIRQRGAGLQGSVNIFRDHISNHYKIE